MSDPTSSPVVRMLTISTNVETSKMTNINLYTDRAQITRSYKFNLSGGTTKLVIQGLPNVLDHNSIRVEGRGDALIQGVSVSKTPLDDFVTKSSHIEELENKKAVASSAVARYKKAMSTVSKYMDTITIEHMDISKLGEAMDVYDTTGEKWEQKIRAAEAEVDRLEDELVKEEQRLEQGEGKAKKKLRTKVEIGLFRSDENDEEVEIILIYAVSGARWKAGYDIRVDMENPNAPVKVIYKASISQRTGEAWKDAPITLETAQPTFGLEIPSLLPWTITTQNPVTDSGRGRGKGLGRYGAMRHRKISDEDTDEECDMDVEVADVTSSGKVNATFRLPGLVSIPSDEEEHGVVIASLELETRVMWGCVPKEGNKVFLEASITNSSEYTFLPGTANVYVDRSFMSRTEIPGVSPKEVFRVSLGVDPTIRVTYSPREKSVAETGFYHKTLKHTLTQRISVHNTKSIAIQGLRIIDQIPVSQDTTLNVTLLTPALTLPEPVSVTGETDAATRSAATKAKMNAPTVKVAEGVVAMWSGTEDVGKGKDLGALGKDGKIDWVCSMTAFGRIDLVLKWEVVAGVKEQIFGL